MKRTGQAVWEGGKNGRGRLTTESKALDDVAYSFAARFENALGTNPEELVGAAHSGCFSMALALALEAEGFTPERIFSKATVSIEKADDGKEFAVTSSHLDVEASIPGIENADFQRLAEDAKLHCPISKLLNAKITMSAKLAQTRAA